MGQTVGGAILSHDTTGIQTHPATSAVYITVRPGGQTGEHPMDYHP